MAHNLCNMFQFTRNGLESYPNICTKNAKVQLIQNERLIGSAPTQSQQRLHPIGHSTVNCSNALTLLYMRPTNRDKVFAFTLPPKQAPTLSTRSARSEDAHRPHTSVRTTHIFNPRVIYYTPAHHMCSHRLQRHISGKHDVSA